MRPDLLLASLYEQRRALLLWCAGWVALVGLYCLAWPAVRDSGSRLDDLVRGLPAGVRALMSGPGGALSLGTPAGYLQAELLSVTGPLLVVVLGLLLGSRAGAGEEERGTLELLLAQPVSRRRVLLEQAGAAACGLLLVMAALAVALRALGGLVQLEVGAGQSVAVATGLALLGLQAAALALLVGAATGRAVTARAVTGLLAVGGYLVHGLAGSVTALAGLDRLTPFRVLALHDPLQQGITPALVLELGLPSVALVLAADALLRRRDLAFA